jgi:hypothetical protein
MKRLFWVILAIFFITAGSDAQGPTEARRYSLFYGSLASHGEWLHMSFGDAWRPFHVGRQWRPYMNGRWIWTDYGWYWNSSEPFGWATYHYGRWIFDDYYGWIWVPDDVWGPAWVEWRYDDDYIGWAPLPPQARFNFSVGITFGSRWVAPVYYWNFVPCANFSSVHIVNYIQTPDIARRIFGRTRSAGSVRAVDRRIVNDGIGLDRIERRSREKIRKVEIVERANPGEGRLTGKDNRERLEVYRPGPEELRKEGVRRDGGTGAVTPGTPGRDAGRTPADARNGRVFQRDPGAVERGAEQPAVRERNAQQPAVRERNAQQPAVRERNAQQPAVRERNAQRPQVTPPRPNVRTQKPEVKRPKPDGNGARPGVSRERAPGTRTKPDGRGSQPRTSGRRGRDG